MTASIIRMHRFVVLMSAALLAALRVAVAAPGTASSLSNHDDDDFDLINSLLLGMALKLPEKTVSPMNSLDLTISELECRNIYLHDITFSHADGRKKEEKEEGEEVVDIEIGLEVDMTCTFDWIYTYDPPLIAPLSSGGRGQIDTKDNAMSTTLVFSSPDFSVKGPVSSTISGCNPNINVKNMEFDGSISAAIVNSVEWAIRGIVENEIEDALCEELGGLGDVVSEQLLNIKALVEPYLSEDNSDRLPNDPLSAEKRLKDDGETIYLFDFTQTEGIVEYGVDAGIRAIDRRLGDLVRDEAGKQDLGINVLLRKYLLDGDGYLSLPINAIPIFHEFDVFVLDEVSVVIKSIRVKGLDSFTSIDALKVLSSQTLQTRFALEYLDIEVVAEVQLRASDDVVVDPKNSNIDNGGGPTMMTSEMLVLSASIRELDAIIALFVAIDEERIGDLQLGSLFHLPNIPQCLLSALHAAEFTQLHLSVGDIDPPTVESISSKGLTRIATSALEAITDMYESLFLDALPAIFDDAVRPLVNELASDFIGNAPKSDCPPPLPDTTESAIIDMRDLLLGADDAVTAGGMGTSPYGTLVSLLKALAEDVLLTPNDQGILPINNLLVGPLTKRQSGIAGTWTMSGDVFNEAVEVNLADVRGVMRLGIFDIAVENIDSVAAPVTFLKPKDAHILSNEATFGAQPRPLRFSMGLLIEVGGEKQQLRNELIVSFELTSVALLVEILMKMNRSSLIAFPLRDILSPYCWISTLPAPALNPNGLRFENNKDMSLVLEKIHAAVEEMKIDVQCISCTSPALEEWSELLSQRDAIESATVTANMLLTYATGLLDGEFVQVLIDRGLNIAASKCGSSPTYGAVVPAFQAFEAEEFVDDSSSSFFLALAIIAAILIVSVASIAFVVHRVVRRQHHRWLRTLTSREIDALVEEQRFQTLEELAADALSTSMATSKSIPLFARIFIPFIVLVNIGLFAAGHFSLGGTIKIAAQVGQQDLSLDSFYNFSIANTVVEMWNAGARGMAMLIAIFSGLWPYVKQLVSLTLWFAPPTPPRWLAGIGLFKRLWPSSKRRGRVLSWLDALGKYSFIDIFVLVIAMVAFQISIESPSVGFLPDNFYSVDLVLVALYGLYFNMSAQILSQWTSHWIVYYHGNVVVDALRRRELEQRASQCQQEEPSRDLEGGDSNGGANSWSDNNSHRDNLEASRLCDRVFTVGDHNPNKRLKTKPWAKYALIGVASAIVLFIIIGCSIPVFHFEVLGLVGVVVESGQQFDRAIAYYSVFSICKSLIEQATFLRMPAQYIGLGLLAIIVVVTTLVMPLILVMFYLRLWFASMNKKHMERTLFVIEIIKSWQVSYGAVLLYNIYYILLVTALPSAC